MAIQLTEGEIYTLRVLETAIQNAQAELGRLNIAKQAQVVLLETKYKAVLSPTTGQLELKEKEDPKVKEKPKE